MINAAKQLAKRLFNVFGLEIRAKQDDMRPRMSMGASLDQLSRLGCDPRTVIDVGVAYHTAELYQAFPEAKLLLIEPLAEFEPSLRKICATYNAEYVLAAAGESAGTATLNIHPDKLGSSLLSELDVLPEETRPRQVPVVPIDQLCSERNFQGPYVIKVDVQGAELQVLAGASRTLRETEVVILEVSLFGMMIGVPQLYDVVAKMKTLGFVVYDLFSLLYRPLDNALAQVDLVFVREDGPFRRSHLYATREQRVAIEREMETRLAEIERKHG